MAKTVNEIVNDAYRKCGMPNGLCLDCAVKLLEDERERCSGGLQAMAKSVKDFFDDIREKEREKEQGGKGVLEVAEDIPECKPEGHQCTQENG